MVYMFVAPGFEEMEVIAPINILRRAKIDITTVGIGQKTIKGAHGIPLVTDIIDTEFKISDITMVILPGGKIGVENLKASTVVNDAIDYCASNDIFIAAICAAPVILAEKGLFKGKHVTAYPKTLDGLTDATLSDKQVVRDGNIITGKSAGAAPEFAFELVKILTTTKEADQVKEDMQ